jgi:metal-sulfur cluster biosynthetic enzyme
MTVSVDAVWEAIDGVIDPELDRSLVELEFVRSVEVGGADVHVALRLPTYWCSPNFAYLMVGDAHEAVRQVPGTERVRIDLVDHFAGERISEAIQAGLSFQEAFPDQAEGELHELRRKFRLKAFVVRQEPVLRAVRLARGDAGAVALRLGDGSAPEGVDDSEWSEYLRRRRDLGMDDGPDELVFTDAQGAALAADGLNDYLRLARSVRISLQSNTEFCTGLLAARYDGEAGVESWQGREVVA